MLDYLLNTAHTFAIEHGVNPDIIYINPLHYEQLIRNSPDLFVPGSRLQPGFRLVILLKNVLAHPRASLLCAERGVITGGTGTFGV